MSTAEKGHYRKATGDQMTTENNRYQPSGPALIACQCGAWRLPVAVLATRCEDRRVHRQAVDGQTCEAALVACTCGHDRRLHPESLSPTALPCEVCMCHDFQAATVARCQACPVYPEGLERKVAALQPIVINGVPYAYDADRDTCRDQRAAHATVSATAHHAGIWEIDPTSGECKCECRACWHAVEGCLCSDCTYPDHHHEAGDLA